MTIDERLQFLVQSTESLHASVQDLWRIVEAHTKEREQDAKEREQDSENIRALARIAEIHERRLTALEGGEDA